MKPRCIRRSRRFSPRCSTCTATAGCSHPTICTTAGSIISTGTPNSIREPAVVAFSSRRDLAGAGEMWRHLGHEARHLVLDLAVGLLADVEIQDHLVEAGVLDLLQDLGDAG